MKKIIAPIVISILMILYYIFFFLVLNFIPGIPFIARVAMGIVPLALVGVVIYVLVQRIREVRSGEEDDLSKY